MPRKATPAPKTLASAALATLSALRAEERLTPADELRVASLLALVESVSAEPTNAALWRELRAVESSLRAVVDVGSGDDFGELLAALGDSSNAKPTNARA